MDMIQINTPLEILVENLVTALRRTTSVEGIPELTEHCAEIACYLQAIVAQCVDEEKGFSSAVIFTLAACSQRVIFENHLVDSVTSDAMVEKLITLFAAIEEYGAENGERSYSHNRNGHDAQPSIFGHVARTGEA
jgi:hypothetical protein